MDPLLGQQRMQMGQQIMQILWTKISRRQGKINVVADFQADGRRSRPFGFSLFDRQQNVFLNLSWD